MNGHGNRKAAQPGLRVGLFGLLGSGNLGNEGSLEAMLAFLRAKHPNAQLAVICPEPEQIRARYGMPAITMQWYDTRSRGSNRVRKVVLKAAGKPIDALRTYRWLRRFDLVIVPGMGILETSLSVRPWGFPYALFLVCALARVTGTKVGLVSVGAECAAEPFTRFMMRSIARFAHYRSYRDALSSDALRQMGVDTGADPVYADLAFARPNPSSADPTRRTVGVGVIDYHGTSADKRRAGEVHRAYAEKMTTLVRWLLDSGYQVRLMVGDQVDNVVASAVTDELRMSHPEQAATQTIVEPCPTFDDLMRQISSVDVLIASRYHHIVCAMKLEKRAISVGYAKKNDVLMTAMGLGDFCQSIRTLDVRRLIEQFKDLEGYRDLAAERMRDQKRTYAGLLDQQYQVLSSTLLAATPRRPAAAPNVE